MSLCSTSLCSVASNQWCCGTIYNMMFFWQRRTQQILSVLYSLWLTPSSSPAAVTGTFTSPTLGRLLPLSFHLHLCRQVNLSSGGRTPPQVLPVWTQPAAGSSDSPRLDRRWFQTWGTREKLRVRLSWTSNHITATWMMSQCHGLRCWMAVSQCQVSLLHRGTLKGQY